jgi:hypothetical protein
MGVCGELLVHGFRTVVNGSFTEAVFEVLKELRVN